MKMKGRLTWTRLMIPALVGLLSGASACTKVEPGYVGIKVNNWVSFRQRCMKSASHSC